MNSTYNQIKKKISSAGIYARMDTPEFIKQTNQQQLKHLDKEIEIHLPLGSVEQRKYSMQIRLLNKLNERELARAKETKRKSSRFTYKGHPAP